MGHRFDPQQREALDVVAECTRRARQIVIDLEGATRKASTALLDVQAGLTVDVGAVRLEFDTACVSLTKLTDTLGGLLQTLERELAREDLPIVPGSGKVN